MALGERPESGGDAVDGLLGLSEGVDGFAVLVHSGQRGLAQVHLRVVAGDVDHLGECEGIGIEVDEV